MDPVERNTIVVDSREAVWRVRVYPNHVKLFLSREGAEAHAQQIACSKTPVWPVIVRHADSVGMG